MYSVLLRNLHSLLFLAMLKGAPRRRHMQIWPSMRAMEFATYIFMILMNYLLKACKYCACVVVVDNIDCLHNPCLSLFRFVPSPERSEFNVEERQVRIETKVLF